MRSTGIFQLGRMCFDRKFFDRWGTIFLHDLYRTNHIKNSSWSDKNFSIKNDLVKISLGQNRFDHKLGTFDRDIDGQIHKMLFALYKSCIFVGLHAFDQKSIDHF